MQIERTLFSDSFFSGISAATGVIGLALICRYFVGADAATIVTLGAICLSFVDTPSPTRHKLNAFLITWLLSNGVMLVIDLVQPNAVAIGVLVMALTFVAAMLSAFGKKAGPVSFSILFTMILALGLPAATLPQLVDRSLWFAAGGFCYLVYGMLVTHWLTLRTKQQALAESLFELAQYLRIKARCYEPGIDLDAQYGKLVNQQAVVAEKQQAARDIIFRHLHSEREAMLANTLIGMFDVYETVLAVQTDYGLLQQHFSGSDAMMFLRDLSNKAALDLEQIAYATLRRRTLPGPVSYKAEAFAMAHELDRLMQVLKVSEPNALPHEIHEARQALETLRGTNNKIAYGIKQIEALHRIAVTPLQPRQFLNGADLRPFMSAYSFSPQIIDKELNLKSPVLRHALRMTMAMGCGYVLAHYLPYASHSYWILLTIAVIMRANFSIARQRRTDRVIGNLFGCIFTAVLLYFAPPTALLLLVMFFAVAIAHTFAQSKYLYTSIAACVMALLQLHFINHGSGFLISERLIDTFVGAALAYGFSFVLPSWEYRGIPRLIVGLLKAEGAYVEAAMNPLAEELSYRLARKQLLDAITALSSAFGRMLGEPKSRHRAVAALNSFIMLNYLLAAQLAAVRVLLQQRRNEAEPEALQALLQASRTHLAQQLLAAQTLTKQQLSIDAASLMLTPPTNKGTPLLPESFPEAAELAAVSANRNVIAILERRLQRIEAVTSDIKNAGAVVVASWNQAAAPRP